MSQLLECSDRGKGKQQTAKCYKLGVYGADIPFEILSYAATPDCSELFIRERDLDYLFLDQDVGAFVKRVRESKNELRALIVSPVTCSAHTPSERLLSFKDIQKHAEEMRLTVLIALTNLKEEELPMEAAAILRNQRGVKECSISVLELQLRAELVCLSAMCSPLPGDSSKIGHLRRVVKQEPEELQLVSDITQTSKMPEPKRIKTHKDVDLNIQEVGISCASPGLSNFATQDPIKRGNLKTANTVREQQEAIISARLRGDQEQNPALNQLAPASTTAKTNEVAHSPSSPASRCALLQKRPVPLQFLSASSQRRSGPVTAPIGRTFPSLRSGMKDNDKGLKRRRPGSDDSSVQYRFQLPSFRHQASTPPKTSTSQHHPAICHTVPIGGYSSQNQKTGNIKIQHPQAQDFHGQPPTPPSPHSAYRFCSITQPRKNISTDFDEHLRDKKAQFMFLMSQAFDIFH